MTTSQNLRRVTVNLVPRASDALDLGIELSGYSQTDTVNRALQVYAYLFSVMSDGGGVYTRAANGAELERLAFM